MSGKIFFDTNILVYSFDHRFPEKCKIARALLKDAISNGSGVISWQVVQEFINVASRKFEQPMSWSEIRDYYLKVLKPLCHVQSSADVTLQALTISSESGYSYYDALMIAAAQRTNCKKLLSEDLQDGHKVAGLTIVNPFTGQSFK